MRRVIFFVLSVILVGIIYAVQGGNLTVLWRPLPLLLQATFIVSLLLSKHSVKSVCRAVVFGSDENGEIKTFGIQASLIGALVAFVLGMIQIMANFTSELIGPPIAAVLVGLLYSALFSGIFLTIRTQANTASDTKIILGHTLSGMGAATLVLMTAHWIVS